jgi:hypothetical protein
MLRLRFSIVGLLLFAISAYAQAVVPAAAVQSAMRCIEGAMTSSVLPVGVMTERIADSALARCFDEIETAAVAIASADNARGRIEAIRAAIRTQLYDYALQVAGATYALPPIAADTADDAMAQSRSNW